MAIPDDDGMENFIKSLFIIKAQKVEVFLFIMPDVNFDLSGQERDLQLLLASLDIVLPAFDPAVIDGYVVIKLTAPAASFLEANNNKAVLLAYRVQGRVFPVLIVFLRGNEEILFCHSTLLLDSYGQGDWTAPLLREITDQFFSNDIGKML